MLKRLFIAAVVCLVTGISVVGGLPAHAATCAGKPSTDDLSYLDEARPLMVSFSEAMERITDDPYDRVTIRRELPDMEALYDAYAELTPPVTLQAAHELSVFSFGLMVAAWQDVLDGDIVSATIKLNVAADLAERATELINEYCPADPDA